MTPMRVARAAAYGARRRTIAIKAAIISSKIACAELPQCVEPGDDAGERERHAARYDRESRGVGER